MPKSVKTCFFQVDGPIRQQSIARSWGYVSGVHRLLDFPEYVLRQSPNEVVELPRAKFQAQMTFQYVSEKRIIMKDRFGLDWSVYGSYIDQLVPLMTKGVIECWWVMTKRGSMYGLVADVDTPLGPLPQDQDVPLMLNATSDIRSLWPQFEALAA